MTVEIPVKETVGIVEENTMIVSMIASMNVSMIVMIIANCGAARSYERLGETD